MAQRPQGPEAAHRGGRHGDDHETRQAPEETGPTVEPEALAELTLPHRLHGELSSVHVGRVVLLRYLPLIPEQRLLLGQRLPVTAVGAGQRRCERRWLVAPPHRSQQTVSACSAGGYAWFMVP